MSASTVSITANPATSRRRPVLVGEKKSNLEFIPNESQLTPGGENDQNVGANSRDLSHHSIRNDAVLEKSSRDAAYNKKPSAAIANHNNNSTVLPRRSRKTSGKHEKARWMTVVSVFTKNFLLLLSLVGLVQMFRWMALKSADPSVASTQMGYSEFEGRIAEVEDFLKTTAKMMQVQVDVVDRKIDNEIGDLKGEINKKIDDRTATLESELKKLETKSVGLENSLSVLNPAEWMSRKGFEKIYEELRKGKSGENDWSLDDLRAYARDIVEKEIERHAADGLGRVDYALAGGGAWVVKHSEPFLGKKGVAWFSGKNVDEVHKDAVKMLKPSFGEPGQCFALKGSSGFVQIRLRSAITPEAITLEHVAKSVAYDRSSAPKDCRVSGWFQGPDINSPVDPGNMFLLAEFSYDLEKSNAQTFQVLESASSGIIDTVMLDFTSNHGMIPHTCIYRLRVHGHEPDPVSIQAL